MGTLHTLLSELGIDNPVLHPEREPGHETGWIVDQTFEPVVGKTYQLAFGRVPFGRELRPVIRTVRIDGPQPQQWFDLEESRYLEQGVNLLSIKAYRCIG